MFSNDFLKDTAFNANRVTKPEDETIEDVLNKMGSVFDENQADCSEEIIDDNFITIPYGEHASVVESLAVLKTKYEIMRNALQLGLSSETIFALLDDESHCTCHHCEHKEV